jgi:hypothetical protein
VYEYEGFYWGYVPSKEACEITVLCVLISMFTLGKGRQKHQERYACRNNSETLPPSCLMKKNPKDLKLKSIPYEKLHNTYSAVLAL